MKVLIIDHGSLLSKEIEEALKSRGFKSNNITVNAFNNDKTTISQHDIILLDVPIMDSVSYDIIEKIRMADKHIPIIVLSPFCQIKNIEKCFILGCNDYLKKPVVIDELIIKLNFWLKYETLQNTQTIHLKDGFTYDSRNYELMKKEIPISLTSKEKLFIEILLKNRGCFVPTPTIIQYVWDEYTDPNQLRVLIYKLRKKVGKDLVISMKGVGYKINNITVQKNIWRADRRSRSTGCLVKR